MLWVHAHLSKCWRGTWSEKGWKPLILTDEGDGEINNSFGWVQCTSGASEGVFPGRRTMLGSFQGWQNFFLRRVNSDEITFYQLEAKRKTFSCENVNMRIRNSKVQCALDLPALSNAHDLHNLTSQSDRTETWSWKNALIFAFPIKTAQKWVFKRHFE